MTKPELLTALEDIQAEIPLNAEPELALAASVLYALTGALHAPPSAIERLSAAATSASVITMNELLCAKHARAAMLN